MSYSGNGHNKIQFRAKARVLDSYADGHGSNPNRVQIVFLLVILNILQIIIIIINGISSNSGSIYFILGKNLLLKHRFC
jgi:hypothetical protein